MLQLRELDLITYRGALALHFTDAVTNQPVADGLHVTAWPFLGSDSPPVYQVVTAEKSPLSALYGFRLLPRLEGYQIGEDIAPESFQYVIQIEDRLNRFLPQTVLVSLPLADVGPQEIILFSAPTRDIPQGFASIRGDLRVTSPPSGGGAEVSVLAAAAWAKVTLTVDGIETQTFADEQGRFLGLVVFPSIPMGTLLSDAEWPVTLTIGHDSIALAADLEAFSAARPGLDIDQTPPFQSTLTAQSDANLFDDVTVIDATTATYGVNGPTNSTSAQFTVQFGQPLVIQTEIDGGPDHLSELLIQS